MLTLYVAHWPKESSSIALTPAHRAHIRARRLRDKDTLRVVDGKGRWQIGTLCLTQGTMLLEAGGQYPAATVQKYLACAWSRPQAMEMIVEKSVEMGITDVLFLLTDYVGCAPNAHDISQRYQRLHALMQSALCQSAAHYTPHLHAPMTLDALHTAYPDVAWVVLDAQGTCPQITASQAKYGILVGPEGGWSVREYHSMRPWTTAVWSVATSILRVETAAIAGMTLMNIMENTL